jgi:periplasmic protein TonB
MTYVGLHAPSDCAPHATRTLALAAAISLNLLLVLLTMRPVPPMAMRPSPTQALDAVIVLPKRVVPIPPMPTLKAVPHVERALPHEPVTNTIRVITPVAPSLAPVAGLQRAATPVTPPPLSTAKPAASDATIAYETATPPAYPIEAVRAGIQGTVLLRVLVDENGKPEGVAIARSSGSRVLDRAALQHVLAAWRFHPATRDGKPVRAWAMVPVKFSLKTL